MKKAVVILAALLGTTVAANKADTVPYAPVLEENFPDPFVIATDKGFYAYATNANGDRANVPMAFSADLKSWALMKEGDRLHDAMPDLPPWVRRGLTWAPEVIATDKGYVLHFTARDKASDLQCLGAAFSTSPTGPFRSDATAPLLCQTQDGGTIDSSPYRDSDGALILYYKNDGNNPAFRKRTIIYAQRMTPDGMGLVGEPVALVDNDQPWEAHVVEAPSMWRSPQGRYILFYSANHYGWEKDQRISVYAMGYAVCESAMGPCKDAPGNPLIYSYKDRKLGCLSGPGHQAPFRVGTRDYIAFHAWAATSGCRKKGDARYLYVAPLVWQGDAPRIARSLRREGR